MKRLTSIATLIVGAAVSAFGLDGQPGTHDPSTVIECSGKYYCYGTGRNIPIMTSDDGWSWRQSGDVLSNLPGGRPGEDVLRYAGGNNGVNAWAPDVIKVGDKYFLYYALSGTAHRAVVGLVTNKTLDPNSPDYKWEDGGPIAWSLGDGMENLHAIDPGVFHDPTDGTLWLVYGSYFGTIRLMELDPRTGKRLQEEQSRTTVANNSEAVDLIYHDGWYYLLVNHGTCSRRDLHLQHPRGTLEEGHRVLPHLPPSGPGGEGETRPYVNRPQHDHSCAFSTDNDNQRWLLNRP